MVSDSEDLTPAQQLKTRRETWACEGKQTALCALPAVCETSCNSLPLPHAFPEGREGTFELCVSVNLTGDMKRKEKERTHLWKTFQTSEEACWIGRKDGRGPCVIVPDLVILLLLETCSWGLEAYGAFYPHSWFFPLAPTPHGPRRERRLVEETLLCPRLVNKTFSLFQTFFLFLFGPGEEELVFPDPTLFLPGDLGSFPHPTVPSPEKALTSLP